MQWRKGVRQSLNAEGCFNHFQIHHAAQVAVALKPASVQQAVVFHIGGGAPVHIGELGQRSWYCGIVKPQWNQAAISLQRVIKANGLALQLRPIRKAGMGRHA
jgi:hypothetical protein